MNHFSPALKSFCRITAELAALTIFTGMIAVWAIILGA